MCTNDAEVYETCLESSGHLWSAGSRQMNSFYSEFLYSTNKSRFVYFACALFTWGANFTVTQISISVDIHIISSSSSNNSIGSLTNNSSSSI